MLLPTPVPLGPIFEPNPGTSCRQTYGLLALGACHLLMHPPRPARPPLQLLSANTTQGSQTASNLAGFTAVTGSSGAFVDG